jgi:hypothetical protein
MALSMFFSTFFPHFCTFHERFFDDKKYRGLAHHAVFPKERRAPETKKNHVSQALMPPKKRHNFPQGHNFKMNQSTLKNSTSLPRVGGTFLGAKWINKNATILIFPD